MSDDTENFKLLDYFSITAVAIELKSNGLSLGPATAFHYEHANLDFLVSNWHVLSGRNTYTGQPLHSSGAIPDELVVRLHAHVEDRYIDFPIKLYKYDGTPKWIQHRKGQSVDIAAIRLKRTPERSHKAPVNQQNSVKAMRMAIATDVFIVGFPQGLKLQKNFPVWKRGSIASEPEWEMEDASSTFLVDTASRPGMSGSPVFLRSNGTVNYQDGSSALHHGGPASEFVGIYSGRFGAGDELSAQLGRVWKKQAVVETLSDPVPGSYQLIAIP